MIIHGNRIALDLAPSAGPRTPPTEFKLFTAGEVNTTKGVFTFDAKSVEMVLAEARDWGNEFPIDYDHAMTDELALDPANAKRAAGWFTPEVRGGELWATNVRWTPPAAAAIANAEWRYVSPTFETDAQKRITALINCALTNLPATKNMQPLVAANRKGTDMKTKAEMLKALAAKGVKCDEDMSLDLLKKMHATLDDSGDDATDTKKLDDDGGDTDASKKSMDDAGGDDTDASKKLDDDTDAAKAPPFTKKTQKTSRNAGVVHALPTALARALGTDDPDEAVGVALALRRSGEQVSTLAKKLERIEGDAIARERGELIAEGVRSGKITPSEAKGEGDEGKFIASLSIGQLRGYLKTAPAKVKVAASGRTESATEEGAVVSLSKAEKDIADNIGVPHDKFLERKKHQISLARSQRTRAQDDASAED